MDAFPIIQSSQKFKTSWKMAKKNPTHFVSLDLNKLPSRALVFTKTKWEWGKKKIEQTFFLKTTIKRFRTTCLQKAKSGFPVRCPHCRHILMAKVFFSLFGHVWAVELHQTLNWHWHWKMDKILFSDEKKTLDCRDGFQHDITDLTADPPKMFSTRHFFLLQVDAWQVKLV